MPRPQKCRFVCKMPDNDSFAPNRDCVEKVVMTVDEYEVIRLIDYENCTQEECAEQINVARTTVQSIYDNARKKIADVIVNGKKLVIEGGEYKLCDRFSENCGKGCRKFCRRKDL